MEYRRARTRSCQFRGLAEYAAENGLHYGRIFLIIVEEDRVQWLDQDPATRLRVPERHHDAAPSRPV